MTDKVDVENAMRVIQEPKNAMRLTRLITERLYDNDQIAALPSPLFDRIAEICAEIYALGYVKGMDNRK